MAEHGSSWILARIRCYVRARGIRSVSPRDGQESFSRSGAGGNPARDERAGRAAGGSLSACRHGRGRPRSGRDK
ncbi:hypothetical protein FRACA_1040007 [Frankia canadensis]|uniref:Uncharacterized protein n=1 Tax=Frankia canadensis TaxID=1836972 RepID=A0A2I2KIV3_9ACTN|nr:hypothetical protein FRACA_1040007 [Frankia canadensis]SOU52892.1 hypothetical protein FRACA_1040007 [Frankia canadensis]